MECVGAGTLLALRDGLNVDSYRLRNLRWLPAGRELFEHRMHSGKLFFIELREIAVPAEVVVRLVSEHAVLLAQELQRTVGNAAIEGFGWSAVLVDLQSEDTVFP